MGNVNIDKLYGICSGYSGHDYYLAGNIPNRKLNNARTSMLIPFREHVLAFIDATVFGSGKHGLAITGSGVYWNNDSTTKMSKNFFSWDEWVQVDIALGERHIYFDSKNAFNMSSSSFNMETAVQLLRHIQNYVIETKGGRQGAQTLQVSPVATAKVPAAADRWMIATGGERFGPYDRNLIQQLLDTNQILPEETYVWQRGMPAWVPLLSQPEIASLINRAFSEAEDPVEPSTTSRIEHSIDQAVGQAIERVQIEAPRRREEAGFEPLDINHASVDELIEVLGIGRIGAERVVEQRQVIRGFQSPEQVGELLGLKPHQVEKLRRQTAYKPLPAHTGRARIVDF